jgi:cellulose synthase/poly-beta-1,6-N-acetylglucosamine synthase-like glycosyltransferase
MQLIILSITVLLFTFYAALILYYATSWRKIPDYTPFQTLLQKQVRPPKVAGTELLPVKISIIIPARNEEQNIKHCLDSINDQSYPKEWYEVLVVDDHSTDSTASIIQQYPSNNVQLIQLQQILGGNAINSYKKKAIETAIGLSAGELIVTTDADCIVPQNWLQTIATFYRQTGAAFIAMPVCFTKPHNFLEIFQSLDFMTLQGITGASVHQRIHSMCNGANMAYTKKVFEAVNGYKGIDSIASGDDMLLMHKIYQHDPGKLFFLKSKAVIVQTAPMHTWRDFFNQRIRWASKADQYNDKRIFAVLMLVYLFNVLLLLLPVLSGFNNNQFSIAGYNCSIFTAWAMLVLFKTMVELIFLYPVARFFSKQRLLWFFPVAQPFHVFYTVIAGWLGKFGSYQWKERKVK